MPYVMIRHKVSDYAKWKRAVKAHAKWRKAAGEKCFYACRNNKSPRDVMVWCEWANGAVMRKFIKSSALHKALKEVGVVGRSQFNFYDTADDLSVK